MSLDLILNEATKLIAVWEAQVVVNGIVDRTVTSTGIASLPVSQEIEASILEFPDGRDHIMWADMQAHYNRLATTFQTSMRNGEPHVLVDQNWHKLDNDPFLRGDWMRRNSEMNIPRNTFIPWDNNLTQEQNRGREGNAILRYIGYYNAPFDRIGIRRFLIAKIQNNEPQAMKVVSLIDHVTSLSNKGDHFSGPIGYEKVVEDQHILAGQRYKLMQVGSYQVFGIDREASPISILRTNRADILNSMSMRVYNDAITRVLN